MLKKTLLIALFSVAMLFVYGCAEPEETEEVVTPLEPEEEELPEEIRQWIEDSRDKFGGRVRVHNGLLYILVTYGEKPTGGYHVDIEEIEKQGDTVKVTARFTEPGEDEMVTQAFTYPYDLAILEETDVEVKFQAAGDEDTLRILE